MEKFHKMVKEMEENKNNTKNVLNEVILMKNHDNFSVKNL